MSLKLDIQHRALKYYQVCSNADPRLTLTFLYKYFIFGSLHETGSQVTDTDPFMIGPLVLASDDTMAVPS